MDSINWVTIVYLAVLLVPMVYLQRILQREIQAIFLLITRQAEISMALFSLLFLPGVFLHEASHFVMARLLGVKTGGFSIIPRKLEGGRIRLGYVETASADFFRDALIGLAPLVTGGIFIAIIGASRLGLNNVWVSLTQGELNSIHLAIKSIVAQPDFWVWFYLVFTVSSTMMPSASDRRAWLPLILVTVVVIGVILLIGVGSLLLAKLGTALLVAINAISMVFGITVLIHVILLIPLFLIRKGISQLVGLKVV
jgi:hypothetical protein